MSQNQLITILTIVLLLVIGGSVAVLLSTSSDSPTPSSTQESPAPATAADSSTFNLAPLEQQAYQLINKQLVREGALPVPPPASVGKANPFL